MPISPTDLLRRCAGCGELVEPIVTTEQGPPPHGFVLRCPTPDCERHMGFAKKPDSDRSRRPTAQRELVKKFGVSYCEFCLLAKHELPPGDTLEGHHIVELCDGGEASELNTLTVCSHCHLLIHFQRTHYAKTIREVRALERGQVDAG